MLELYIHIILTTGGIGNLILELMNKKDYLILTKGRAICLVLDTARVLLSDLHLDNELYNLTRKECEEEILNIIIQVATFSIGYDEWPKVYDFISKAGIFIPDEFNISMRYMDSISEIPPKETHNNWFNKIIRLQM